MLPVFPSSSLDSSILTSVMVGLLVVWVLQETLGWTFSGLVVPGYLATILLIQPQAALVISAEAVLTWALYVVVSDRIPAWGPWTPLFGRDRFMAFLLASVGVRLVLEGGGFARLAVLAGEAIDPDLHAMGLVVVPLMAHAMWRAGWGGVPQVGIPVFITWAILRFALLPATNLSLTSFALAYEDLSADFIVSPRHYLLVLMGATFGSWANLRWGWDFGGIVVPGLFALCWLEPERLAATLGEAIVIAILLRACLRLPWLRSANLTGGRPLVLGYLLGYLVKLGLGWTFGGAWPGFDVRSLFGFGYLLPTIVALRIVKHGEIFRCLVPATVTSFGAAVAAQGVAAVLLFLLPPPGPSTSPPERLDGTEATLVAAAWADEGPPPPLAEHLARPIAAMLSGGSGFGALHIRADGAPLALVTRLGPLGVADATLSMARALDARVVHLCAPEGDACGAAWGELDDGLLLVEVVDGAGAPAAGGLLTVDGAVPAGLDLARLGALAPFRLAQAPGHVRFALDEARRLALATPGPGPLPWSPVALPEGAPQTRDAAAARALREEVLRPWMRWRDHARAAAPGASAPTAAPRAPDSASPAALALGAAAARAGWFGLELRAGEEGSTLRGPGWEAAVRAGAGETLVSIPVAEPGTWGFGVALAQLLDAGSVVAGEGDDAALTLAGLVAAGGTRARVVEVRGASPSVDPGADVVLSTGGELGADVPAFARAIGETMAAQGLRVGWFDGTAQRRSFGLVAGPAREAARSAAGQDAYVAVWVSAALGRRFLPGAGEAPWPPPRSGGAPGLFPAVAPVAPLGGLRR